MRFFRRVLIILVFVAGAVLAYRAGWMAIPGAYNPFATLDVRHTPNLITWLKMQRIEMDPQACFAALETSSLQYSRFPDREAAAGCPLIDTVRVTGSPTRYNRSFVATCLLAVALVMFQRHALAPAAARHLDRQVVRLDHVGTFACRNIYGRERGRRSEHATANAIDITGFVLSDGRRITISGNWTKDTDASRFLHQVRDDGCRFFDTVLSPDYNRAHHDHLHLDMGGFRVCR